MNRPVGEKQTQVQPLRHIHGSKSELKSVSFSLAEIAAMICVANKIDLNVDKLDKISI